MYENLINVKTNLIDFMDERLSFTVSGRDIWRYTSESVIKYLKTEYMYCRTDRIRSVFGHTADYSPLYGGRPYLKKNALTDKQIAELEEAGTGIALTLTNHFFSEDKYRETLPLLKKHHKAINSVICTNDELAIRIKNDFPEYHLKASLIKNINTLEKVDAALKLYKSIVIPMDKNDDNKFLINIQEKDRIILFGNAGCAYTCPQRSCYLGFSRGENESVCSKNRIPREDKGYVFFDVKKFLSFGFDQIKLVPCSSKKPFWANKESSFDQTKSEGEMDYEKGMDCTQN